jgi:hypothetical protein
MAFNPDGSDGIALGVAMALVRLLESELRLTPKRTPECGTDLIVLT